MTALLHAAQFGTPGTVNLLIEAGADDVKNNAGDNAMLLAARWNTPEMLKTLLEAGADINVIDKDGKTVMDYASMNEKLQVSDTLKELKEKFLKKEA